MMIQLTENSLCQERNRQRRVEQELKQIIRRLDKCETLEEAKEMTNNRLNIKLKYSSILCQAISHLVNNNNKKLDEVLKFKVLRYFKQIGKLHKKIKRPMKLKMIRDEIKELIMANIINALKVGDLDSSFIYNDEHYTVNLKVEKTQIINKELKL